MNRRTFLHAIAGSAGALALPSASATPAFRLNYLLASSMYGNLPLSEILPEVKKTGASAIELWPKVHGTQREEMEAIGHEKFAEMLQQHRVKLAGSTRFDLGPFKLGEELEIVKKFGGSVIVCGASGNGKLEGAELKAEVKKFAEKMKPHGEKALSLGVTIAVENHLRALLEKADALRWMAEFAPPGVGISLAPYHLSQDAEALGQLVRDLGPKLALFYAWQFGQSCSKPMPKEQELEQMPGRGKLDFKPMLAALRDLHFTGPTEIFMHPTPRGFPILPTAAEVTAEINRGRAYLEGLLA